jgi:hypothetical protein
MGALYSSVRILLGDGQSTAPWRGIGLNRVGVWFAGGLMLRRFFVGAALIALFASLSFGGRHPAAVEAAPVNESAASISFADHEDGSGETIEFRRGEGAIYAMVDYPSGGSGSHLSYILRLNGDDYKWGDLKCGSTCSSFTFRIDSKDNGSIPGGAYEVLVYDGDTEIARGGFGVKGGKGSDNDNDH